MTSAGIPLLSTTTSGVNFGGANSISGCSVFIARKRLNQALAEIIPISIRTLNQQLLQLKDPFFRLLKSGHR